ncbi:carboxypeptidase B-like [Trichogramma pretiosum]|uniref:carboxypeptidase B-like n=1 Tax=Trichogramma pretiosum TaxID=7493 RepID=UPI000C71AA3F|nr:carboxypeptidase B-like [Trichogramma pretiosum]
MNFFKMKSLSEFMVFALVIMIYAVVNHAEHQNMKALRVFCDTDKQMKTVASFEGQLGFDFLLMPRSKLRPVEVLVSMNNVQSFINTLQKHGIRYEIHADDVHEMIRKEMNAQQVITMRFGDEKELPLTYYPRYNEVKEYLESLGQLYEGYVTTSSIGKSYEGRELLIVKFSTGGGRKPALLIDAGIHAREWIAPTTALFAIKQLAENPSSRYIFQNVDLYIIPMINPDGYEYTHHNETTRLWRKTRSKLPGSDCFGVDANRNFDFNWLGAGTSSVPCSNTYAGPYAFSEPETRALRDFVLAHKNDIKAYLSLHSFGQYMLHPWGYTSDLPVNEPTLKCVAEKAAKALQEVNGTPYQIGSSTNLLYAAAGGSDDYVMAVGKVPLSYTIELPGGYFQFAPPPKYINFIGEETFEAIKVFANYIDKQIC